jgi:hypothetical protein
MKIFSVIIPAVFIFSLINAENAKAQISGSDTSKKVVVVREYQPIINDAYKIT